MTKNCTRCQEKKSEDLFYLRKTGKRDSWCRLCNKKSSAVWRSQNRDKHRTGKVRGLLCEERNKGLGHFIDSKDNLENALKYVKSSMEGVTCVGEE